MGLNVVQTHAKSITDGIKSPLYKLPLVAYITPPNPGKLTGPAAYVWATNGTNRRQTMPRGAGFRETNWSISIWLMSPDTASNPNADSAFAALVDSVVEAWVTTTMPISIEDPLTGLTTQLVSVGEEFTIEQSPAHVLADQRIFLYEALIRFTIKEIAQP
jgi:hypothetical protein